MADHESVQQAETAAAGKVSELSEAMIRVLLQQRAEQAKDRNQKQDQPPQPYVPSTGDAALFNSFYQQYRENGVDNRTARDAAADAAIGLGSQDSPAMANAEAQAIAQAQQQAKEYRSVAATAVNPDTPAADRQQANVRRKEIEQDLGINDQPPEVRAQTINGLDPNGKQPRQQLQENYQETLQQHGVSPETAASASQDLANNRALSIVHLLPRRTRKSISTTSLRTCTRAFMSSMASHLKLLRQRRINLREETAQIAHLKCTAPTMRRWQTSRIPSRLLLLRPHSR